MDAIHPEFDLLQVGVGGRLEAVPTQPSQSTAESTPGLLPPSTVSSGIAHTHRPHTLKHIERPHIPRRRVDFTKTETCHQRPPVLRDHSDERS